MALGQQMAEQTPESRNRYVDFLRAASIMVVVFGHWLMAAPVITEPGSRPTTFSPAPPGPTTSPGSCR